MKDSLDCKPTNRLSKEEKKRINNEYWEQELRKAEVTGKDPYHWIRTYNPELMVGVDWRENLKRLKEKDALNSTGESASSQP